MTAPERLIEYRNPADLRAYEGNTRTHSDEQIELLRASIREFGFTNPILLKDDEATIGAGHARAQAAILEGLERVPTIALHGLTDIQWRAYVIADNQLAIRGAGWDEERLRIEIEALTAEGFDIPLVGFDPAELERLFNPPQPGNTDPDELPEEPAVPATRPGDVWLLGNHRLACGDSTSAADVNSVLVGSVPHLLVSDPPYGVEYDASWRNEAAKQGLIGQKKSTRATGKVQNDDRADWREAWELFPGDVAYIWHAGNKCHIVAESMISCGFEVRAQIIWNKNNIVIGRGDYHPKHEPCLYVVRKGKTGHWNGDRKQSTVWDIDKPMKSETGHSTQKPVECMRRPIANNSKPGDLIYEPFSGSGTTLIACEMEGRHCRAIELHPPYVDMAVTRWQAFAGQEARLEATDQTFAEVKAERVPEAEPAAA